MTADPETGPPESVGPTANPAANPTNKPFAGDGLIACPECDRLHVRPEFIGKVATPVANKLFECGMIP